MTSQQLLSELSQWTVPEVIAALLALAYLVLAARQNIWCWACAFVSTAIYFQLFLQRSLYHQSLLQVFYLAMAVYGFVHWRRGGPGNDNLPVSTWPAKRHLQALIGVLTLTALTGWLEAQYTSAPLPYLDAFTTWGAVITTWMVTRKILENWLYWLVVDSLTIYLYLATGFPATALLFMIYLGIVVAGYINWRRSLLQRASA